MVVALATPLPRGEFHVPIVENHARGSTFFGTYDRTQPTRDRIHRDFCDQALAFFLDVARAQPSASAEKEDREVYPQFEKRKKVAAHLRRERSRLLATHCKIRDKYKCKVCGFSFEKRHGPELGAGFAEAHHVKPLAKLNGNKKTKLEDLITVCANCHRMLHRMKGKTQDLANLRDIVRQSKAR